MTPHNQSANPSYKIAYIHAASFPSGEANTFDSVWSAAALAEKSDVTFFVPRLNSSLSELQAYYEVPNSPLKFRSMYLNFIPDRVLLKYRSTYENLLKWYFRLHPRWQDKTQKKVLYVREPRELRYWGLNRSRLAWMKDWIFCYEAHDTLGLDPQLFWTLQKELPADSR